MFGFIFSTVNDLVKQVSLEERDVEEKLAHVREFCRKNRMSYNLSSRVRDFYAVFYERQV